MEVQSPQLFTTAVFNYASSWVVDRTVSGLTVIWGKPGSGKSFVAVSLAAAVASGRPWMGRAVTQGPVVYAAGEGGVPNVALRAQAALRVIGAPWKEEPLEDEQPPPLYILGGGCNLLEGPEKLGRALGDTQPSLLVLDTLQRFFGGGNENQQDDMGKFVESVARLQDAFRCSVLVVHHANRSGKVRGSSVLDASADVVWKLEQGRGPQTKGQGKRVVLTPEKLRECDVEGGELSVMLNREPAFGPDGEPLLDDVGRTVGTLGVGPAKPFLDSVKHAGDRARILLQALDVITYQQWHDVCEMQDATFNNAVHAVLLQPGEWGVVHQGKGNFSLDPEHRGK